MNDKIRKEDLKEVIQEGIQAFYEKNRINVLAINDKLLSSTDLGKTQNIGAKATNKILHKAGILEENTDQDSTAKWRVTDKGKNYAVTPLKFTISKNNENSFVVHIKEENPKWLQNFKEEFSSIVKEDKNVK